MMVFEGLRVRMNSGALNGNCLRCHHCYIVSLHKRQTAVPRKNNGFYAREVIESHGIMYPKINRLQFVIPITIWRKLPMEGIQTTSPKSRQKTPLKLFQQSSASRHQTAWFPRCSFFCQFSRWAHEVRHPMRPRGATEDFFALESFGDATQHRYFERQ